MILLERENVWMLLLLLESARERVLEGERKKEKMLESWMLERENVWMLLLLLESAKEREKKCYCCWMLESARDCCWMLESSTVDDDTVGECVFECWRIL
jgi:hypothetical protein